MARKDGWALPLPKAHLILRYAHSQKLIAPRHLGAATNKTRPLVSGHMHIYIENT